MAKRKSARELMGMLESDPNWVAAREQKNQQNRAWTEAIHQNEMPIVEELQAAGFHVESVAGLYPKRRPTDIGGLDQDISPTLPILMKHFCLSYHFEVRSLIVSALSNDWAFPAFDMLVGELKRTRFSAEAEIAFGIDYIESHVGSHYSHAQIEYYTTNHWEVYCFRLADTVCYLAKREHIPLLLDVIDDDRYIDGVRCGLYDLLEERLTENWRMPLPMEMKRLKKSLISSRKRLNSKKPTWPE